MSFLPTTANNISVLLWLRLTLLPKSIQILSISFTPRFLTEIPQQPSCPSTPLVFQYIGITCFCTLKKWLLKSDYHLWTPVPSKADCQETLLTSSLRLKSPFPDSSVPKSFSCTSRDFKLNHSMISVAKTDADHHFIHKTVSIYKQQI